MESSSRWFVSWLISSNRNGLNCWERIRVSYSMYWMLVDRMYSSSNSTSDNGSHSAPSIRSLPLMGDWATAFYFVRLDENDQSLKKSSDPKKWNTCTDFLSNFLCQVFSLFSWNVNVPLHRLTVVRASCCSCALIRFPWRWRWITSLYYSQQSMFKNEFL